jgi:predicted Zn-dependent protease
MAGYPNKDKGYQMWITDLQLLALDAPSGNKIMEECLEIAEMLIKKNISYGNSALEPIRIFSKADSKEQIRVRIDDKLNRIQNDQAFPGDNDIEDLIGYLILLKIANKS